MSWCLRVLFLLLIRFDLLWDLFPFLRAFDICDQLLECPEGSERLQVRLLLEFLRKVQLRIQLESLFQRGNSFGWAPQLSQRASSLIVSIGVRLVDNYGGVGGLQASYASFDRPQPTTYVAWYSLGQAQLPFLEARALRAGDHEEFAPLQD
jgi:hypothetical protein